MPYPGLVPVSAVLGVEAGLLVFVKCFLDLLRADEQPGAEFVAMAADDKFIPGPWINSLGVFAGENLVATGVALHEPVTGIEPARPAWKAGMQTITSHRHKVFWALRPCDRKEHALLCSFSSPRTRPSCRKRLRLARAPMSLDI
jgi:hypothetical protein